MAETSAQSACGVQWPQPLAQGRFIRRPNRFAVEIETAAGETLPIHLPNSGRMTELLVPGASVLYHPSGRRDRCTAGDMLLVHHQGRWVSVDARMPNHLFRACFERGALPGCEQYTELRAEVPLAASRIDFLLRDSHSPGQRCWVETKSCNLVEEGTALFPDAPTLRGTRHLLELQRAVAAGDEGAVIFFIQRDDARRFRPHRQADPDFADALAAAVAAGVKVSAYLCRVDPQAIQMLDRVPVELA